MDLMKRLVLLLSLPGALLCAGELSEVRSVYVMPMYRGLDQYLVNRLTSEKVFQVVTDPKLADAIFTDRVGDGFQSKLEAISPSPKAPEPPAEESKEEDGDRPKLITQTVNKLQNPALNSSFGRGKGTLFLVEVKSRQVIWSTYEPAPDSAGKEMDRASLNVISRLMKDLGLKKK